jgi:hypothetical protein
MLNWGGLIFPKGLTLFKAENADRMAELAESMSDWMAVRSLPAVSFKNVLNCVA